MLIRASLQIELGAGARRELKTAYGGFAFEMLKERTYNAIVRAIDFRSSSCRVTRRKDLEQYRPGIAEMHVAYTAEVETVLFDAEEVRRSMIVRLSAVGEEMCGLGGSFRITRETESPTGAFTDYYGSDLPRMILQ